MSRGYFTAEDSLQSSFHKDEEHTKNIAASLYSGTLRVLVVYVHELSLLPHIAGSDTVRVTRFSLAKFHSNNQSFQTNVVMTNFMLVLLLYPEVQQRAQKEIDSVIGRERLPTHEDRGKLPYIEAMCKEILRWRPVTQMGMRLPP